MTVNCPRPRHDGKRPGGRPPRSPTSLRDADLASSGSHRPCPSDSVARQCRRRASGESRSVDP
eukprot:1678370-Alexandrium_andersonii.AAC.1